MRFLLAFFGKDDKPPVIFEIFERLVFFILNAIPATILREGTV